MKRAEATLQRAIRRTLTHDHGCLVVKNHGGGFTTWHTRKHSSSRGLPDLTVIAQTHDDEWDIMIPSYIWLEVKLPGETLSKVQKKTHEIMISLGCEVHTVRSVKEAVGWVKGK